METWKQIDNVYFVSNLGRVKSVDTFKEFTNFNNTIVTRKQYGKLLTPKDNGAGYLSVTMGRGEREYVHRLVGIHFLKGRTNEKKYINHKNGIKSDNRVENLEWVTASENQNHSKQSGLCKLGEKHPQSKLSNADIIFIRKNYHLGTKILANKFKVGRPTICNIANGKSRKHG